MCAYMSIDMLGGPCVVTCAWIFGYVVMAYGYSYGYVVMAHIVMACA